jgi:NAD(P)H-hydrate epimerase
VVVLAGPGGNGGSLVAARHLLKRGSTVSVVLSDPDSVTPVPAHPADILGRMGLVIAGFSAPADLVVDALLGYRWRGGPTGPASTLIEWANQQPAPILALHTPSGLNVITGAAVKPPIEATATLTLGLSKVRLIGSAAVGELYLADISVPAIVYQRTRLTPPELFHDDVIIRVG